MKFNFGLGGGNLSVILFVQLFNMPLFTIISGYCGLGSLKRITNLKDLVKYNFRNFKRIYLPALSMGSLIFTIEYILGYKPSIHIIVNEYWFLTMLFVIMIVLSFLWLLSSSMIQSNVMLLFIPLAFIILIFIEPARIGEMIPFFLVGLLLKQTDVVNRLLSRKWIALTVVFITVVLLSILEVTGLIRNTLSSFYNYNFNHFLHSGTLHFWVLRTFLSVLMCLSFISVIYHLSKSYTLFSWIGSQSLSLYLFSCIPLIIWEKRDSSPMIISNNLYNIISSNEILMYISNTITFAITMIFCLFLALYLGKWKYTRFLFLGKD